MTWSISINGHKEPWDEEFEKEVAEIGRRMLASVRDELDSRGMSSARFGGNFYSENYLAQPDAE